MNKWAKLDIMCTRCHGKAEIISEIAGIKLCNKCYDKYIKIEKNEIIKSYNYINKITKRGINMKPSEFITNYKNVICYGLNKNYDTIDYAIPINCITELDKRFIDKEEFKEKIYDVFENTALLQPCGEYEPSNVLNCGDKYFDTLKNRILALLEE